MLSNSLEDLQAGYTRVKNKESEVQIHSKVLSAFSESVNESRLKENYANGRGKHDNNKIEYNGKGSKRKVGEMERKAAAVEIQDSRIVRLPRLTGGKDRHSKVRTAKGLRDRRVRLSGPTAIQLYDLQDRLCLEQPSMAVDWLIKAAKSAIDELVVLDTEMASASPGNLAQLTSSNCSNVEHCVGSPRESATAAAATGLAGFRVGLTNPKALEGRDSDKTINGKAISITNLKESDLRRSSSSTSDGSIKGSAEYTSNCSMSKPASMREKRSKARERTKEKSTSAQNPVGSPPGIQQLNSRLPSFTSTFKNYFPYPTLPLESHCNKDADNPCGIHTQVSCGLDSIQQLWGYNNTPSNTDMLCTQDSHPVQNMPSYSTAALQKSFQPAQSTAASIQAVTGSSCIQSYEMADSANPFFHPKQIRHLGSNGAQGQANLCYSNIPNMIIKSGDQQQQQQTQMHIRHFGSTFVPTFSNDTHFSTSSFSSRGPLQSNSSSITNMPSLSHTQKNAYSEASAKAAHDFVSIQDIDARLFQEFHNAQDNVKYGHNQLWGKEKEHR